MMARSYIHRSDSFATNICVCKNHAISCNKHVLIPNNWLISGHYFAIIESKVNILLFGKILPLKTMLKPTWAGEPWPSVLLLI